MTLQQIQRWIEILKNTILSLKDSSLDPDRITIHHTAGLSGIYSDNELHRQNWNSKSKLGWYLGYHYYIDRLGNTTQTRLDDEQGIHTAWNNYRNLGIALEGNMSLLQPSKLQLDELTRLLELKMTAYKIPKSRVYGHREFNRTECPGNNLQYWIIKYRSI